MAGLALIGGAVWRRVTATATGGSALLLSVVCLLSLAPRAAADDVTQGPVGNVDPFVGTTSGAPNFGTGGGGGNTFPGASLPFGMIGFGPDTEPALRNGPSGYSYEDHLIRGFSLKHASGAGCSIYQDVSMLPTTAQLRGSPVRPRDSDFERRYMGSFSHRREVASPGFYRVQLDSGKRTGVALAAARRAGVARVRFPRSGPATVLVNAGASATGNSAASVQLDPALGEISGTVTGGGFCHHDNSYTLHFVARFNHDFASFGTWRRGDLTRGSLESVDFLKDTGADSSGEANRKGPTAQAGAFVTFGRGQRTVEVRVGISYVSVENARANLEAEVGGRSLGAVRGAASATWNETLGRVAVSGGKPAHTRRFYTALYHALLHPSTFSDANGEYIGMDGQVHLAEGFTKYTDFAGWDVYRSQIPLLAMLFPDRASDIVQSLIADWRESGWLPRFSVANGHTGVSPGDPADSVIASTYALGARDFDQAAAFQAMVQGATEYGASANGGYVQRPGLPEYTDLGYVPHELNSSSHEESIASNYRLVKGSASTTLEYAIADFAIARFAAAQCNPLAYASFAGRSGNWHGVFNPASRYVQPRLSSGTFVPVAPNGREGFVEGSSAQYTWSVPHDVAGLISALGGTTEATRRLDSFFARINAGPAADAAYLGNEPTLGTPWLYAWLGQPYRTQELVRRALLRLYEDSPGGFPGNDDLGQMSSWYVLGALGFYPAVPGTDVLVLGSPLFRTAVLHLPGGDVVIEAPSAAGRHPYVEGMTIDGLSYDRPWLQFAELADGARLDFALSGDPNLEWGSGPEDAPPSFGPTAPFPGECS